MMAIHANAIAAIAKALASEHGITYDQAMLAIKEQRKTFKWFPIQSGKVEKRIPEDIEPTIKTNIPGTKRNNHSNRDPLKLRSLASNNNSGCTGVSRVTKTSKWQAQIGHKGKVIHLGSYTDFNEAAIARKDAERKLGFHA